MSAIEQCRTTALGTCAFTACLRPGRLQRPAVTDKPPCGTEMAGCPTGRPCCRPSITTSSFTCPTDQCHRRPEGTALLDWWGNLTMARSQTSGCASMRRWCHTWGFGVAHHPARALRWRWHFSGTGTLDSLPPWVLPARARPLPIVPSALHRGTGEKSITQAVLWRGHLMMPVRSTRWLAEQRKCGEWVVYAKRPFAGRGRAGLPVALYAPRCDLESTTGGHGPKIGVTFRWKDYRVKGRTRHKTMTLAPAEFASPLPAACAAYWSIRHYGLLVTSGDGRILRQGGHLLNTSPPEPVMNQAAVACAQFRMQMLRRRHACC